MRSVDLKWFWLVRPHTTVPCSVRPREAQILELLRHSAAVSGVIYLWVSTTSASWHYRKRFNFFLLNLSVIRLLGGLPLFSGPMAAWLSALKSKNVSGTPLRWSIFNTIWTNISLKGTIAAAISWTSKDLFSARKSFRRINIEWALSSGKLVHWAPLRYGEEDTMVHLNAADVLNAAFPISPSIAAFGKWRRRQQQQQ